MNLQKNHFSKREVTKEGPTDFQAESIFFVAVDGLNSGHDLCNFRTIALQATPYRIILLLKDVLNVICNLQLWYHMKVIQPGTYL